MVVFVLSNNALSWRSRCRKVLPCWLGASEAIVLPLLLVFVVTDLFRAQIVNTIYKNVEDISDSEMPSTVTSFQSGPEVVSTIGGSGEGLNCSLPRLANYFFDRME